MATENSFRKRTEEECLQEFHDQTPASAGGDFLKFEDGEQKILEFLVGEDEKGENYMRWVVKPGFNPGDPERTAARFKVIESKTDTKWTWDTSKKTAIKIMRNVDRGDKILVVERIGKLKNTEYQCWPHHETKKT